MVRLGYGASDLDTEADFGKYGRVTFMIDEREKLLNEAKKLAASLGMCANYDVDRLMELFFRSV